MLQTLSHTILHLVKTKIGAAWAFRQMRELGKLGCQIHVALPPGSSTLDEYRSAGIVVHEMNTDFPIRRPWEFLEMRHRFRTLVDQVQPDIIHSHFVGTTLTMRLALGKKSSIPRIFQVPGPLHLEHPFFRHSEILTAGEPDHWIGSCQWTCRRYRLSGIAPERIFLSYYGNDLNTRPAAEPGSLRREYNIAPNTKIIGMVAYMYPPKPYLGQIRGLKGHEDFIDALAVCLRSDPNLVGVIVGGAWNGAAAYERKVRAYGEQKLGDRILFLGTRPDVARLYADFDLVVHPSHSENIGGAGESLMLGIPTVATNVGGFPDVVKPGRTGWLVPPKNPHRLSQAILDALADPARCRQYASAGHQLAKELLSISVNAQGIADIYTKIHSRRAVLPLEKMLIGKD